MAKQFNFNIAVSTNANVTSERIAEVLRILINSGLEDARDTMSDGEGDVDAAELALDLNISAPHVLPSETSIKVKRWNAYNIDGTVDTHQFDIDDQRESSGQAYITVGAIEGGLDDLLSVTMEVNANPLTGIEHVPCAHVHFDNDSVAFSLYKIGDKILMRPETNVSLTSTYQKVNGFGESLFWVE